MLLHFYFYCFSLIKNEYFNRLMFHLQGVIISYFSWLFQLQN